MSETKGYSIPVHASLMEAMTIGGVPRSFALINGTLAMAMLLGLQTPYALPFNIAAHLFVWAYSKKDQDFLGVLVRSLKYRSYYRP